MKKDGLITTRKELILIAKFYIEKGELTTYQFAKKHCSWADSYELQKKDCFIRKFLNKYERYGIFKSEIKNRSKTYLLDRSKIIINPLKIRGKKTASIGIKIDESIIACSL